MKFYYTSEQSCKTDDRLQFPYQKGYGRGCKADTYIKVLIIWDHVPPDWYVSFRSVKNGEGQDS